MRSLNVHSRLRRQPMETLLVSFSQRCTTQSQLQFRRLISTAIRSPTGDRHQHARRKHFTLFGVSYPWLKSTCHRRGFVESTTDVQEPNVQRNMEVHCTLYDTLGKVIDTKTMSKLDIAASYGFSTRDLRNIDIASEESSHILVRPDTILIRMSSLRLLVQATQVLQLYSDESNNGTAPHNATDDHISQLFSRVLETKLKQNRVIGASGRLPFELNVIEAALAAAILTIETRFARIKQQASEILSNLDVQMHGQDENVMYSELRAILDLVRNLAHIGKRAQQVRNAVHEVLNEDQDMANMYLSDKRAGKPHAIEDHQEVEYLLEAYYKASNAVVQDVDSLTDNIQRTEQTIKSILDVRRNQIMVLEAKIEILMLGLASATFVAGLYGMNVVNYAEEARYGFAIVTAFCLVGILFTTRYGLRRLYRIRTESLKGKVR